MTINFINISGRPFLTKRNFIMHAEMKELHVTPQFIAGPGRDNFGSYHLAKQRGSTTLTKGTAE